MNRRESVLALLAMDTAGEPVSVFAQERRPRSPFRIGLVPDMQSSPLIKTFSDALRDLGRVEGRDRAYGGLMAYGPGLAEITRRHAWMTDRILKGSEVERNSGGGTHQIRLQHQPEDSPLAGTHNSPSLLVQADEVIE